MDIDYAWEILHMRGMTKKEFDALVKDALKNGIDLEECIRVLLDEKNDTFSGNYSVE